MRAVGLVGIVLATIYINGANMGSSTSIAWTDATHNPVAGCSIESPGCQKCYAMKLAGTRLSAHPMYGGTTKVVNGNHVFNGVLKEHPNPDVFQWPARWKGSKAPRLGPGKPSMIFVCDMSDLFHPHREFEVIDRVIGPCATSKHISQFLTKRPVVMAHYFSDWKHRPSKFWLGFSAEDQRRFDERWPYMKRLAKDGWIIYVSIEPQIDRVWLPKDFLALGDRAWVIIGGESGPRARSWDQLWGQELIQQCEGAGVAVFMKQFGAKPFLREHPLKLVHGKGEDPNDWPGWMRVRQFPKAGVPA